MTSLFKQRFIEMTGKEIPLDFFLYSCLEAEKMLAAAEKRAGGPEQVESRYLDAALAEGLTATDVGAWEQAIGTLYAWHCKREPALTESSMVDIQALCPVTTEFAAFHADLRHLYHSVTSENLPLFNKEAGLAPVWTAVTKVIDHKSSFAAGLFEEILRHFFQHLGLVAIVAEEGGIADPGPGNDIADEHLIERLAGQKIDQRRLDG